MKMRLLQIHEDIVGFIHVVVQFGIQPWLSSLGVLHHIIVERLVQFLCCDRLLLLLVTTSAFSRLCVSCFACIRFSTWSLAWCTSTTSSISSRRLVDRFTQTLVSSVRCSLSATSVCKLYSRHGCRTTRGPFTDTSGSWPIETVRHRTRLSAGAWWLNTIEHTALTWALCLWAIVKLAKSVNHDPVNTSEHIYHHL